MITIRVVEDPTHLLHTPIVVTSASGGAGVTSVALHLTRALAARGGACYFEAQADAGGAERLGLDRGRTRAWPGDPESDDVGLAALPLADGFRALFAPPGGVSPDAALDALPPALGRVVVDQPSRASALARRSLVVVVVPTAVSGAARAAPLLDSLNPPRAIVLNRLGGGSEATRSDLERMLRTPIAVELPVRASLRAAEDDGRLLSVRSRWSRLIDRLARAIERELKGRAIPA